MTNLKRTKKIANLAIVLTFLLHYNSTTVFTIQQVNAYNTLDQLAESSRELFNQQTQRLQRVTSRAAEDVFHSIPRQFNALTGELSQQMQDVSRQLWNKTSRLCLWRCPAGVGVGVGVGEQTEKDTTHLLLFTQPETGDKADFVATKNILPDAIARDGFIFDPTKPNILIIHGFRGRDIIHQSWALDLKDLILSKEDANVFFADWSHHARVLSYTHALNSVGLVAYDLWNIFSKFELAFPEFKMNKMNVVGHSLGAHVAGVFGQIMDGELEQITALDPAGVLITSEGAENKLSKDDAKYVLALHTNSNSFGTEMQLADRDVYLNGGDAQPGCRGLTAATCSHRRAAKYISTKMGNCVMVAYLCANYDKFERGECGFCERNSSTCLAGAGLDWQFDNLKPGALKPTNLGPSKRKQSKVHQWRNDGNKYYTETLAESPYCAFTYQIVVKFLREPFQNANNNSSRSFLLILKAPSSGEQLSVIVSNRFDPNANLKVFAGNRRQAEEDNNGSNNGLRNNDRPAKRQPGELLTVRGRYLFTALGLLGTSRAKQAPKFQEAYLASASRGAKRELNWGQNEAVVYVNFMSHVSFEERASRSGPLKAKWLSNARQFRDKAGGGGGGGGASSNGASSVARTSSRSPRAASARLGHTV